MIFEKRRICPSFFVRNAQYTVLSDFPVKGDFKRVSPHSIIEGPVGSVPQISERNTFDRITDVETRVILVDKILSSFTPIELREYGPIMNVERRRYIDFMYGSEAVEENRLPLTELTKLGEDVLQRLQKIAPTPVVGESTFASHTVRDDQCVLELTVGMGKTYRHYPTVYLKAFGPAEVTSHYLKQLGLERLNDLFKTKDAQEVGIENSLRRGLAYDLSFEGINLDKIENQENIIL